MLLGEPAATQYDLHFEFGGIPVRVHPFFWLTGLILGYRSDGMGLLVIIVALFVSILVHELGHSMMMRYFGISSHIVLYMMGGLAIPDTYGFGSRRSNAQQGVLISVAGPAAGFGLAGLIAVLIIATGGSFSIHLDQFPYFWRPSLSLPDTDSSQLIKLFVSVMLEINILWGLINLLPVFPLDGGQIARHILVEKDPWQGVLKSLWLSVYIGGAVVLYAAFILGNLFIAAMFGMLAYQSYLAIRQVGGGGFGGGSFGGRRPW